MPEMIKGTAKIFYTLRVFKHPTCQNMLARPQALSAVVQGSRGHLHFTQITREGIVELKCLKRW